MTNCTRCDDAKRRHSDSAEECASLRAEVERLKAELDSIQMSVHVDGSIHFKGTLAIDSNALNHTGGFSTEITVPFPLISK